MVSKGAFRGKFLDDLIETRFVGPLSKLLKRFPDDFKSGRLKIEKGARWGYKLSFGMRLPKKKLIRAKVKGKDLEKLVAGLREEVERQIKEYRSRVMKRG